MREIGQVIIDGEETVRFDRNGLVVLSRQECLMLLAQASVGRVAVSINALPAIFPVNFAMLGEDVVFRTGTGMKLAAAVTNSVVAFEIDEFDYERRWGWSVMVVGTASEVMTAIDREAAEQLNLSPWAVGVHQTRFIRIDTGMVSGRRLVPDDESQPIHPVQGAALRTGTSQDRAHGRYQ